MGRQLLVVNELSEVESFFEPKLPRISFLPEIGLIGPVQNLGVRQKFAFLNDTDLLRGFSP
jgi:hypothetical protein